MKTLYEFKIDPPRMWVRCSKYIYALLRTHYSKRISLDGGKTWNEEINPDYNNYEKNDYYPA